MHPSAGRVEGFWKRLSGMDAAQSPKGHGWPFGLGLCKKPVAREPGATGPMVGPVSCAYYSFAKNSKSPGGEISVLKYTLTVS